MGAPAFASVLTSTSPVHKPLVDSTVLQTVDPLEFRLKLLRAGIEECLLQTAHLVSHSTRLIDSLPRDSLFTLIPNS
jgi:hypothetical protein